MECSNLHADVTSTGRSYCHINRQVILSRPHLWWDGSADGSISERADHEQATPAEGSQYEPKQAAIQCSLTSISVAAVAIQMAHVYTLVAGVAAGSTGNSQGINRQQGHTLVL